MGSPKQILGLLQWKSCDSNENSIGVSWLKKKKKLGSSSWGVRGDLSLVSYISIVT